MFPPSSSGLVGTAYIGTPRPVMPASRVASNRRSRDKIADRECRRDKTLGILTFGAATVPTAHWLRLKGSGALSKKSTAGQHPIGAASHGAYPVLFCARTLACPTLAKALPNGRSSAPIFAVASPERHRPRQIPLQPIFISIVPVTGPAPSLEKRIRVTSNIGGVHSLKAPSFNPP